MLSLAASKYWKLLNLPYGDLCRHCARLQSVCVFSEGVYLWFYTKLPIGVYLWSHVVTWDCCLYCVCMEPGQLGMALDNSCLRELDLCLFHQIVIVQSMAHNRIYKILSTILWCNSMHSLYFSMPIEFNVLPTIE